jgi:hypothetical protein
MHDHRHRPRLGAPGRTGSLKEWLGRVAGVAMGLALLVVGFVFSLLLLAAVASVAVAAWGYVWWKSRAARNRVREAPSSGRVIEGEVLRDSEGR